MFPDEILSGLTLLEDVRQNWGVQESVETAPFGELLVAADLRDHLKLPNSNRETAKLNLLCKAARMFIEKKYSLCLIDTSMVQTMDQIRRVIEITRRPVLSITSVEYIPNLDVDNWLTVNTAIYTSSGNTLTPGPSAPPATKVFTRSVWPASRGYQSFRVRYNCGWLPRNNDGDAPTALANARAAVPEDLKQVVLWMASAMYQGREGQLYNPNAEQRNLLDVFRGLPPAVLEIMEAYQDFSL